ncbi:NAC domain-containing protein 72-like [Euphorbia lathyris]|uniref:NAC domain-containing protein 72-like n=1 Tax=Euphorbia lathyris TaxID=212925 RepID=UPI003314485D
MANFSFALDDIPSDEAIIKQLLSNREKLESNCDVFGDKDPWMLFDKDAPLVHYVFVDLRKRKEINNGKRVKRTAGCGTWTYRVSKKVCNSEGQHIGFKRFRVFQPIGGDMADNGRWVMNEYLTTEYGDDYVLCAIRNKVLEPRREKRILAYGDGCVIDITTGEKIDIDEPNE